MPIQHDADVWQEERSPFHSLTHVATYERSASCVHCVTVSGIQDLIKNQLHYRASEQWTHSSVDSKKVDVLVKLTSQTEQQDCCFIWVVCLKLFYLTPFCPSPDDTFLADVILRTGQKFSSNLKPFLKSKVLHQDSLKLRVIKWTQNFKI